jgi:hypothetical protein
LARLRRTGTGEVIPRQLFEILNEWHGKLPYFGAQECGPSVFRVNPALKTNTLLRLAYPKKFRYFISFKRKVNKAIARAESVFQENPKTKEKILS